jgi:hypothetical protein
MDVRKAFHPNPDVTVHGVEFNRDQTSFVAACEDGFRGSFLTSLMLAMLICSQYTTRPLAISSAIGNFKARCSLPPFCSNPTSSP